MCEKHSKVSWIEPQDINRKTGEIWTPSTVYLRAKVDGLTLQFSYSLDGEEYTSIAGLLDCSDLSDEAYSDIGHEGHTGTFIGMACQDLSGKNIPADFEFFAYKRT